MVHTYLDMNDPNNPIAKVRKVEINFTAHYSGDDAWNQDILVPKLELFLREKGYDLRAYRPTGNQWDVNGNRVTDDDMREYIYRKHGHTQGKCPSCPDPIKWREVERLMLQEYYSNKEILDDPRQGRTKVKFQDETFRNPSPYETKEETMHRLKLIEKTEEEKKLYEETRKLNVWETKTQEIEDIHDFEPKLQFELTKKSTKNGRK